MNNSRIALDGLPTLEEKPNVDRTPLLQEREAKLLKIIEAIRGVEKTTEWSTLKSEIFDNLVNVLERELKDEGKKENPDPLKLNRLAGQLKWAEKYSNLSKLENIFRVELSGLRKNLYGTESSG